MQRSEREIAKFQQQKKSSMSQQQQQQHDELIKKKKMKIAHTQTVTNLQQTSRFVGICFKYEETGFT